jgi:sigma-B regulation protein RsbU (phosphoserine phosphatase)
MHLAPTRKTVAVLVDHLDYLQGGYATQVRTGLERACIERDLDLLLFVGHEIGAGPQADVYQLVHQDRVDGVVLLTAGISAFSGLAGVSGLLEGYADLPLFSLGVPIPGVPSVVADNRRGLCDLIEHLILDHSRRRIAFLAGHDRNPDALTRFAAYREALVRHGLEAGDDLVWGPAFDPVSGNHAAEQLLRSGVDVDAVGAERRPPPALGFWR